MPAVANSRSVYVSRKNPRLSANTRYLLKKILVLARNFVPGVLGFYPSRAPLPKLGNKLRVGVDSLHQLAESCRIGRKEKTRVRHNLPVEDRIVRKNAATVPHRT